jgi:dolichyl-phosphate beta-glucosyltransferase
MSTYLSIILPIFNEEKRLPLCLAHITDYLWHYTKYSFEILCVLNGCTDGSYTIASNFANRWPQVKLVIVPEAGKGRAVKEGMLMASGEYRYMADVDLATPIDEIQKFLEAIHGNPVWNIPAFDVVVGCRRPRYETFTRSAAHLIYSQLVKPLTRVSDPQCGFKMFRAEAAEQVFDKMTTPGWGFDVEALHIAERLGYKVREVNVRWKHTPGSKLSPLRDGWQMARDLVRLRKIHVV